MPAAASDVSAVGLERALRNAGLKSTRPRMLVLRFLRERGGHYSADQITDALTKVDASLLRGSVYNVLNKLLDHGLINLADIGPGRALYESGSAWHHHFVCRQCGTVVDVPCVVGAKPCIDADLGGAELDEAQIIFRGRCGACVRGSLHSPRGSENRREDLAVTPQESEITREGAAVTPPGPA